MNHSPLPWTSELEWAHDIDGHLFDAGRWIADADGVCIAKGIINPNDADLICRMANALASSEQWQDISTAPKDGTWILLHACVEGRDIIGSSQWDHHKGCWFWQWNAQPTSWRKLTAPPRSEAQTHA